MTTNAAGPARMILPSVLAELRRDFDVASAALGAAFDVGRASMTAPLPRPADRALRGSHLRLVGGGAR